MTVDPWRHVRAAAVVAGLVLAACSPAGPPAAGPPVAPADAALLDVQLSASLPPGLQMRRLRLRLWGTGAAGGAALLKEVEVRSLVNVERAAGRGLRLFRGPVPPGPLRLELEALLVSRADTGVYFSAVQLTAEGAHVVQLGRGVERQVEAELALEGKQVLQSLRQRLRWHFREGPL
jgi:hypothetical protein